MIDDDEITLIERVQRRIQSDDCDQSERLAARYEGATPSEREAIDDVFICLCGYSLQTLINEETPS